MTTSIGFDIFARDRASSTFRTVGGSAEKSTSGLHKLGSTLMKVGAGFAAFEGARKAVEFLKSSTEAAMEDQAAQRKLALALKNTTGANTEQIGGVQDWITKQSEALGISKDELMPAFQRLAESTGSVTKAQKQMKIALDVSAGTGKNLATVSTALMKANNGSTTGLSRLGIKTKQVTTDTVGLEAAHLAVTQSQDALTAATKKYGAHSDQARAATVTLDKAQQSLHDTLRNGKTTTLTMDQALHKMSDTFGGQAKAKAHSFEGTMARLSTTWHEAKVQVGEQLIPILQKLADWIIGKGIPAVKNFGEQFKSGVGTAGLLKDALVVLGHTVMSVGGFLLKHKAVLVGLVAVWGAWRAAVIAQNTVAAISLIRLKLQTEGTVENAIATKVAAGATKAWTAAQWLFNAAMDANPIGITIVAVAALAVGLVIAYKKSETFRHIVQTAFHAVLTAASKVADFFTKDIPHAFDKVKSAASSSLGWLKSHWPLVLAILAGPFGLAVLLIAKNWNRIKDGATATVAWFRSLPGKFANALGSLASTLFHIGQDAFNKLGDAERAGITKVLGLVKSIPGKVKAAIGSLSKLLWNAGSQIIQGLIDGVTSKISSLKSKLGGITKIIPDWKGPLDKDRILLKPAGVAIMEGLIDGIGSKQVALQTVLSKVTASVQAAGQKLQDALSARNSFAAGFQGFSTSLFGGAEQTDADGNPIKPTAHSIIGFEKDQARQAHKIKTDVRKLTKMGLSPALLKQLQAQGSAGLPEIEALAHGSRADIRRVNALNRQTTQDLHSAGMTAANKLYGHQIAQDRRHYAEEKHLLGEIRDLLKSEHNAGHEVVAVRIEGHDLVALLKKVQRTTGAKP